MQTTTTTYNVGDWVQAVTEITEHEFNGGHWIHAEPGAIGHVMHVDPDDGGPFVFFERTGTSTYVEPDEVALLCHAEGPAPSVEVKATHDALDVLRAMLAGREALRAMVLQRRPAQWEGIAVKLDEEIEALRLAEEKFRR